MGASSRMRKTIRHFVLSSHEPNTAHKRWGDAGSSNESDDPGCGNYIFVHDPAE